MSAPRVLNLTLRRAATPGLTRFTPAGRSVQQRFAATEHISASDASSILVKQRLARPVSPHLSIYRPQITWYASGFNRLAGIAMSGTMYIFGIAYLAAPALGWHLETPSLVAAFGALPLVAKVAAKMTIAFPFFFHSFNGVRHLVWDVGMGFANKTVMRTGWTVVGLSVLGSLYFSVFV
ncbi:cytochrome b560 subunit of succinate dehydrogenase [Lepidopterella palustris CBS 459.81]|uniref:Cytochrome b560 subunit of succinate dehydrogenase n=1 Tax=Lepidopterella palustris CBS 459.81 TaxID=1314670 RepID=A0A8E2JH10_9PEZI|nr:cytochrome b560 subunit of succinate dehydrogenase [Lepidopterella palustris CBS 459.81]